MTTELRRYRVFVNELSVDYSSIAAAIERPLDLEALGALILETLGDYYSSLHADCFLLTFNQGGATYLFDNASAEDLPHEDRAGATGALTPADLKAGCELPEGIPDAAG